MAVYIAKNAYFDVIKGIKGYIRLYAHIDCIMKFGTAIYRFRLKTIHL